MINILINIIFTIITILVYIAFLVGVLFWSMQFKKTTAFFISEFMDIWEIKIDDLYIKSKK